MLVEVTMVPALSSTRALIQEAGGEGLVCCHSGMEAWEEMPSKPRRSFSIALQGCGGSSVRHTEPKVRAWYGRAGLSTSAHTCPGSPLSVELLDVVGGELNVSRGVHADWAVG